jgi:hypothetical protein
LIVERYILNCLLILRVEVSLLDFYCYWEVRDKCWIVYSYWGMRNQCWIV